MNMLQKELAEAKGNLEDMQYEKEEAEKKIIEPYPAWSMIKQEATPLTLQNLKWTMLMLTL